MSEVISIKKLNKVYKLFSSNKERILNLFSPQNYGSDFYALKNIDFTANEGEVIGFIGINGSGKSTLSNIIAGIVPETTGDVKVNGQASLIAVAAGLKNDLSGRDNIELKLLMLGFNKNEIKELESSIIEFSELGKFIDQPVKSYSSGMKSRLGFSISVNVDPDILIIDEALSVGDKAFAEKSLKKMREFKEDGKTMIFVSHSINQMKQFCDKILWLENGEVKFFGSVDEVIPKYELFLSKWQKMSKTERNNYMGEPLKVRNELIYKSLKNQSDIPKLKEKSKPFEEMPVSFVGEVKVFNDFVFSNLNELQSDTYSSTLKNESFYIKKKASLDTEIFYLLSRMPSGKDGIIGWVRASSIRKRSLTLVEYDRKEFLLNGEGNAHNIPWGKKKNIVLRGLKEYKGKKFIVSETVLIGKGPWYKGVIEGENMDDSIWIYGKRLVKVDD